MMVIFLVGLVSMILMRTLRKDYQRYSKDEEMDDMVIINFAMCADKLWEFNSFIGSIYKAAVQTLN